MLIMTASITQAVKIIVKGVNKIYVKIWVPVSRPFSVNKKLQLVYTSV